MKDRIRKIDEKLSIILDKLSYNAYKEFIRTNRYLRKYDFILGKTDIGKLPQITKLLITNNLLDEVEKEVDRKLRLIDLIEKKI